MRVGAGRKQAAPIAGAVQKGMNLSRLLCRPLCVSRYGFVARPLNQTRKYGPPLKQCWLGSRRLFSQWPNCRLPESWRHAMNLTRPERVPW